MTEPSSLGTYLRTQRTAQHVSLESLSQRTKISLTKLQALEDGCYRDLPSETYLKGFLAGYAEALDLPFDDLLKRYRAEGDRATASVFTLPVSETPSVSATAILFRVALGCLVLALIYGLSSLWRTATDPVLAPVVENTDSRPSQETQLRAAPDPGADLDQPVVEISPVAEERTPVVPATPEVVEQDPLSVPVKNVDPLPSAALLPGRLLLEAIKPVQIQLAIDGRPVRTYTLTSGSLLRWRITSSLQLIVDQPENVIAQLSETRLTFDAAGHFEYSVTPQQR
ncbi:MAG: hypothetical protein C0618_06765 [Desulfuromonas sp.]|nr:MAG: hypothetical protein C0618_06765 [Desulfuromonas sp.]